MKTARLKQWGGRLLWRRLCAGLLIGLAGAANLTAATVTTLGGGPGNGTDNSYGYVDGNTLSVAQFNRPAGIALNTTNTLLFVADQNNNAIRQLDLVAGITSTFTTNKISQPVAVVLDQTNNVYVLNRGKGTNGTVVWFNQYKNFKGTLASNLVNATALAIDGLNNLYVTESNSIIEFPLAGGSNNILTLATNAIITTNLSTSAVITNKGVWFMGIAVLPNGTLAVTDAKNNGIWLVNPVLQTYSQLTGFNGAGEAFGEAAYVQLNQPYGIAYAGNGLAVVTDYGNDDVKYVDTSDGTVQFLYGIPPDDWYPGEEFPGWFDGDACDLANENCAEANEPYGVVVAQDGDVYTTEIYYDIIRETTSTGFSGPGTTPGESPLFNNPQGVAEDNAGAGLYIADQANNAIQLLDLGNNTTSTFLDSGDGINRPSAVAFDDYDDLYVLNEGTDGNGSILEFDEFGDLLGTNAVGLSMPTAMTIDAFGDIYVAEQGGAVQEFNGGTSNLVATVTNADVSLQGIALFSDATIAVSDAGNDVVWQINPVTQGVSVLTGAVGQAGDSHTRLNQPHQLFLASGNQILAADTGNSRIVVIQRSGSITNVLVSTNSEVWFGRTGDPYVYSSSQWVPMSAPVGVTVGASGIVYDSEDTAQDIRGILSTGLVAPPPPTPAATPVIGGVVYETNDITTLVVTTNSTYVFNNDTPVAIEGNGDSQIYYTYGPTVDASLIPDPSATNGSSATPYLEGQAGLPPSIIGIAPDQTIKAVGVNPGEPDSPIVEARVEYVAANPTVSGENGAQFTVSDLTTNAEMWYTTDGSTPVASGSDSVGPIANGTTLSLGVTTNLTFKIIAYCNNYQSSGVVTVNFTAANFSANTITWGFASGEASSDFVASPGQNFYAPVTLTVLPGTEMYSLQFNMSVTNLAGSPAVPLGGVSFQSFLVEPNPLLSGFYETIPPAMTVTNALLSGVYSNPPPANLLFTNNLGVPFVDLETVDTNDSLNLVSVGWLERYTESSLYPTLSQDLIQYSLPHDTLFLQQNGQVVVGGFAFLVPPSAAGSNTYQIQIGRPSATSDGIGKPGSEVYIATPTNGSLTTGAINAIKNVTIGQRKYIAGDCAPFRWFNAGDFGDGYILNDDVEQVFQSAIYAINSPPPGSDFFDSMDSCCGTYVTSPNGYLVPSAATLASTNALFSGDDTTINSLAFGDGKLDVTDVYVTFRRSLDPSLVWFERFWTNGIRAAEITANVFPEGGGSEDLQDSFFTISPDNPAVAFYAGDAQGTPGQTVQIPITARTSGSYPLRVLMLNLTLEPLDGSPPITNAVQFTPNAALGSPALATSSGPGNYAAAWLDSTIAGLSTNATIGTLSVTLPAGAGPLAAYAVHFDHASGSPNGLASFPVTARTGVLTLSDRSSSSFNDGIPDLWRLRYFGTAYNILSEATADADGDGADNWEEYEAGTDPTDAKSVFRQIPMLSTNATSYTIQWPTAVGKQYVVEISSSLYGTNWVPVSTNAGTGWNVQFYDTNPGSAPRFYRVQAQ